MAELSGKKILVLVTNQGVEQDELKVPADKLRADGAEVTVAAPESGKVKSLDPATRRGTIAITAKQGDRRIFGRAQAVIQFN